MLTRSVLSSFLVLGPHQASYFSFDFYWSSPSLSHLSADSTPLPALSAGLRRVCPIHPDLRLFLSLADGFLVGSLPTGFHWKAFQATSVGESLEFAGVALLVILHVSDPYRWTAFTLVLNILVFFGGEGQWIGVQNGSKCVKSISGLVHPVVVTVWYDKPTAVYKIYWQHACYTRLCRKCGVYCI